MVNLVITIQCTIDMVIFFRIFEILEKSDNIMLSAYSETYNLSPAEASTVTTVQWVTVRKVDRRMDIEIPSGFDYHSTSHIIFVTINILIASLNVIQFLSVCG